MKRAVGISNKSAKSIETRFQVMNRNIAAGASNIAGVVGKAFAGAAALRGAQVLIDASTRIENSLKVAGLAGEELTRVYDTLFTSAQRNAAPLEALVDLYGRASLVQKELGVTTGELLGFTDKVAVALRVSGKSAAESSGALLQLSQALGAGTVRAEEFNSILEGALPIAQAAAAGLEEAGGSVAKLRALVVDGKVSSEAFFRAFEAGSSILTDKVAGAELTVSQGFIRLQNVLIDTAGKFDTATGGTSRLGVGLDQLSNDITQLGDTAERNGPAIDRFLDFLNAAATDFSNSVFAGTERELQGIAGAVDTISAALDRYGSSVTDAELATAQAEQALVNFAQNGASQFGALEPVIQDLIQQLLEGRGTAETASDAIDAIGQAGDFGPLLGQLSGLVDGLFAVRSEAVATAAAVAAAQRGETAGTNIESQRAEQQANRPKPPVRRVTIEQYPVTPGGSGSGSAGPGSSKKTPGENFQEDIDRQAERNRLMREQTALQATLNPLVNDYGFAIERLRVQQELQSAATQAGLELTPELKAKIDELATGYANASVEASRLAESQDQLKQIASDFGNAGSSAIKGFTSDLREGKSAADALSNAMSSILDSVIDIGLNALLGGFGGGGGLFAGLGSLFGFAGGGYTGAGPKNKPAGIVHAGEVVWSQKDIARAGGVGVVEALRRGYANGGVVGSPGPVTGRPANSNGALIVHIDLDNELLNAQVTDTAGRVVAEAAPAIIKRANQNAPGVIADTQRRFGA
jgi:tape measure domain-containing protein